MYLQAVLKHRKTLSICRLLCTSCLGRTNVIQQKQRLHQQYWQLQPQARLQPQQLQVQQQRNLSVGMSLQEKVTVTFVRSNGDKIEATGKVGDSLLDVVVDNNIDLDGFGACEGTLTCSTCHLIFKQSDYSKLPTKASDEELDMLDLAYELTDTSRLGCQINLTKDMNGLEVHVPATINDVRNS